MFYGDQQLVLVDGLGEEAEHPGAGRLDGVGNGAVGGHDDHRHAEPLGLDPLEQRQPVHAPHAQIAQHQVGPLLAQPVQRSFGAVGGIHLVTLAAQAHAHQLEQAGIIVHQQNTAHALTPSWRKTRSLRRGPELSWLTSPIELTLVELLVDGGELLYLLA